jgi:hypothetical protein
MKKIVFVFVFILISLVSLQNNKVSAQCAMCTINAEQGVKNGNTQAKGLNTGVIYLMVIPYLLIGGLGALWYFRFRKKSSGNALQA